MKDGIESLGRVRIQGITLLVVAFLVGALAGVAADRALFRRASAPQAFERPRPGPTFLPPPLERLDLSEEQRRQIRDILERRQPNTDSILHAALPQLRAITDTIREEIREVLTPQQRERLDREFPRLLGPRGMRRPPGRGFRRPGPPLRQPPDSESTRP